MVLHFSKRIDLIRNTFSNESQPLHSTFPSESNVFAADSDKHFWKSAKDKVILHRKLSYGKKRDCLITNKIKSQPIAPLSS